MSTDDPVPSAGRVTSRDVARAAGVSQATVSLVMGGKWSGRVSESTAQRVRATADELGYRPNIAARNLRLGRTRTALLVVPSLTSEFFAQVYTGAARVAAEHDFGLVLYPSPEGIGPARDPFPSARQAVDGVIASSMAAQALAAIRGVDGGNGGATAGGATGGGLPLVMLDSAPAQPGETGVATVTHDVADGVRQAVDHLTQLGHRRIAHLAAAVDSWTFRERATAFAARCAEAGVHGWSARTPLSVSGARDAALSVLHGDPRPTALVCDDDLVAAGACKAARLLGLAVPTDVSVTGFDDIAIARALDPELTTVRLTAEELGAHGMSALLRLLDGGLPARVVLPVRLKVRGSTAPPPV
ncbi:LacI family DNA-binding transcriptional regulator [Allostreptomyces psammosilenae]|uniref:DNA-binding LacI/PurR family transcriptional regulator n=1 Tax=Allostreptomyces psammosilenae TaxID=1892865 RepID=A0A852ZNL5_9ACTN|nr:LacI family DNA-binding transcriptional regulator [Allostreptomyces psammosilenae]NYI03989.1 DNA-binding LacI/PurR family transcriptional regulator [Allostreptomyces psammosilenae]